MKISEVCIERPVLAWVLTLVFVLLGVVGGNRLPLQQLPKIERPFITIETSLPGAGPEIIETQITKKIEETIAGLEGVESITSTSGTEDSKVSVEYRDGVRMEEAANDIRDRLNKIANDLPQEATKPTLTKSKAEERAIITLALTSEERNPSELNDFALREIQKDIESVPGVARVDVLGPGQYVMHIFIHPLQLTAHNLTVHDVIKAMRRHNIEKPAGKLRGADREYSVTTIATMETAEEFNNTVIAERGKNLIRLKDVGRAEVNADDRKTRTRYNGKPGVSIGVVKQSTANPIEVAREVKKMIPVLKERLPKDIEIHIGTDRTRYIEQSINEVYRTIIEATILVILVVFAFLRSMRASLIPLITIPVSLIGALFCMYLLDFSINTLTLMAMVLAIGLVVDDAIIVLENIYRHIEKGLSVLDATVKGIREISFAVIATTLTLVAVYIPISLAKGFTGKLFTEFALTLAASVLISGFVALTLSPMMCARLLRKHEEEKNKPSTAPSWYEKLKDRLDTDRFLRRVEASYSIGLAKTLGHPFRVLAGVIVFVLVGAATYMTLPDEFMPKEDYGYVQIEGKGPLTGTLEYTDKYVAQIDDLIKTLPDIDRSVTQVTNPTFEIFIQMKDKRELSSDDMVKLLKPKLDKIIGIEPRVEASSSGGDRSNKVEFVVMGNKTPRELKDLTRLVTMRLYKDKIADMVLTEMHASEPEDFTVTLNRNKVASLNIEPETVAETIGSMIHGHKAGTFRKDNKLYDVKVEIEDQSRQTFQDISNLFVKAGDKKETLVPLSELVKIQSRASPLEIRHYNRQRSMVVTGFLKSGVSLGEAVSQIKQIGQEVIPAQEARIEFISETRRYLSESQNIYLIFALALAFIFLIMAAQFESWRDPLVIILSVPLAMTGALVVLACVPGGSLNIYSKIGFVTLIGLITKHGIMMVDVANKLRLAGKEIVEAITEASRMRLRPILMTTCAMVLGSVPLALATGAGAESRRQIGWVIVGGMSIGTLFTLFVVPLFYLWISRKTIRIMTVSGIISSDSTEKPSKTKSSPE